MIRGTAITPKVDGTGGAMLRAGVWTFPVGAIAAVYNRVVLQTSFGAHRAPLQTEGRVVAPVYDRRGRRGSAGSAALPKQLKGRALLPRRPDLPSTSHGKNRAPQEASREGSGGRKGRE